MLDGEGKINVMKTTGVRSKAVWAATLSLVVLVPAFQGAVVAPPGPLPFGAYDPGGDFTTDTDVQLEHVFLPWEDVSLVSLA